MKYVIFQRGDVILPVIFPDHVTHSEVKVGAPARPVAAGFCYLNEKGLEISPAPSESLGLGPSPRDGELVAAVLMNSGLYAFTP